MKSKAWNKKSHLWERQKQLESEIEAKTKEIRTEETSGIALQKQSEGFLIEFNRLSEENQDLRYQLHTVDSRISRSSIKKNTWASLYSNNFLV